MMRTGAAWIGLRLLAGALLVAWQAACSPPWTIRPLRGEAEKRFDPVAYVNGIWSEKVLAEATQSAIDIRSVLEPNTEPAADRRTSRSFFVKGAGVVTEVDRKSRAGLARIDLIPVDGRSDLAIQIGPVVRGTAVRDALPFIQFTNFVNQLDYADVANELNRRVLETVLAPVAIGDLQGKTVTFLAAVTRPASAAAALEMVPVTLRIEETRR